ncbi:MAG TPA: hypothetical protein VN708_10850 [Terriglobales bacterium]|jgi:hypothetical protein|nr:hypothetical protein [Terriglobales bacterium]
MGVWGSGLYSSDFAADLGAAIRAVSRLPFEAGRLVDILSSIEPGAANNDADEDHTTFWLVTADQFAKRGIACQRVRDKALQIIDSGGDLDLLARLGMSSTMLKQRAKVLADLRVRVESFTTAEKARPVLKKPQPLLMQLGDVLAYPTSQGKCINSYYPSKERIPNWKQDGWGVAIVVDLGRAFDYLAWYRHITPFAALGSKPDAEIIVSLEPWILRRPGTCSSVHFKRMELENIGRVEVDSAKVHTFFPEMKPGTYQAINDISIANELSVRASGTTPNSDAAPQRRQVVPIVPTISDIRSITA